MWSYMIVFPPPSLHTYFRFTNCIGCLYSNDSMALQRPGFDGHEKTLLGYIPRELKEDSFIDLGKALGRDIEPS